MGPQVRQLITAIEKGNMELLQESTARNAAEQAARAAEAHAHATQLEAEAQQQRAQEAEFIAQTAQLLVENTKRDADSKLQKAALRVQQAELEATRAQATLEAIRNAPVLQADATHARRLAVAEQDAKVQHRYAITLQENFEAVMQATLQRNADELSEKYQRILLQKQGEIEANLRTHFEQEQAQKNAELEKVQMREAELGPAS